MKKKIKILVAILLVISIALTVSVILMQNHELKKISEEKEQLTTQDGFITTSDHLSQMAGQDVGKKVVELGAGTSFDLSNYEGYENFTNDNFIVTYSANASAGLSTGCKNGYCYWFWSGVNFTGPIVNYNADNGKLTITNQSLASTMGHNGSGTNYNMTGSTTVSNVYLIY